ncbi:hypothetical protein KAJ27_05115 [bacterium]|nr:hypothetical protein [bacterium]
MGQPLLKSNEILKYFATLNSEQRASEFVRKRIRSDAKKIRNKDLEYYHIILGAVASTEGDWKAVQKHNEAAIKVSSNKKNAYFNYMISLAAVGYFSKLFEIGEITLRENYDLQTATFYIKYLVMYGEIETAKIIIDKLKLKTKDHNFLIPILQRIEKAQILFDHSGINSGDIIKFMSLAETCFLNHPIYISNSRFSLKDRDNQWCYFLEVFIDGTRELALNVQKDIDLIDSKVNEFGVKLIQMIIRTGESRCLLCFDDSNYSVNKSGPPIVYFIYQEEDGWYVESNQIDVLVVESTQEEAIIEIRNNLLDSFDMLNEEVDEALSPKLLAQKRFLNAAITKS